MKETLKRRRDEAKLSCADVGKAIGVTRSSVSAWENPKRKASPSKENLMALANLYGTTVDVLLGHNTHSASARAELPGTVPVITLEKVMLDKPQMIELAKEFIFCPIEHGPRTYAFKVTGRAMLSESPTSYPEGRIVYCDPDLVSSVTNGQNIIGLIKSETIVFREYRNEEGRQWLRSLNPEYRVIESGFQILAVVIGSFQPEPVRI